MLDTAEVALLNSLHRHIRSIGDALMAGDSLTAMAECGHAEAVLAAIHTHANAVAFPAGASS